MQKKVIIASESAYRRNLLSNMLSSHKEILIVEIVRNGKELVNLIKNKEPDVLILDIEYKSKDWLIPFNLYIKQIDIPIILLTDIDPKNIDPHEIPIFLKLYDYIIKPKGLWKEVLPNLEELLISKVIFIESRRFDKTDNKARHPSKNFSIKENQQNRMNKIVDLSKNSTHQTHYRTEDFFLDNSPITISKVPTKIIVIGASVGGPRTLRTILSDIPFNFPAPILVVQHLNHLFMRQFAVSLKDICKVKVKIGENYEKIKPGIIYLSPGDKHMQVTVKENKPCVRTFEGEPVNFCRPSVDVLFYSTARVYKNNTLGILLTGMGKDGVEGLRAIKFNGGKTIAESEETSILYGMPKVAANTGAADLIVPNYKIIDEIIKFTT